MIEMCYLVAKQNIVYDGELETDARMSRIIRSKEEWPSARDAVIPLRRQVERDGIAI